MTPASPDRRGFLGTLLAVFFGRFFGKKALAAESEKEPVPTPAPHIIMVTHDPVVRRTTTVYDAEGRVTSITDHIEPGSDFTL
jgi:hypothetical protein